MVVWCGMWWYARVVVVLLHHCGEWWCGGMLWCGSGMVAWWCGMLWCGSGMGYGGMVVSGGVLVWYVVVW